MLQQVLTFADQENPELYLTRPSLMNIMKQAGYKTFWITNQQTMTKRNTMLTNFLAADGRTVLSQQQPRPELALHRRERARPFRKVLADPAGEEIHRRAPAGHAHEVRYRYPPEFARFNDRKGIADWATADQVPVINNYDNAVLYNDEVVAKLIETYSAAKPNGLMVYFSDHGEDVFDSARHNILGRNEGRPTVPMYAVPFFIWGIRKLEAGTPAGLRRLPRPPLPDLAFSSTPGPT